MATIGEKMTAIANAIRTKTGGTVKLTLDTMASSLNNIPERTSSNLTASGATVTVPAGNYKAQATKSVATATQATPSISVNSSGLITASATQTAGYVSAGTKSATKQLTTKAATTITPSTSNQTVAAGTYLTGALTIAGDADLVAANIVSGKNIFNVAGNHTCPSHVLNFTVVGGTTQPSSPAANTIWVNTSTSITSWVFSATQPTSPSNGMVWIKTGTSCDVTFNALKTNNITVYPLECKQYVSNAWVDKVAKTYQSSAWHDWWSGQLFINGNQYTNMTGGWVVYPLTANAPLIEINNSVILCKGKCYDTAATVNKIDITAFNTLTVVLETKPPDGELTFGVSSSEMSWNPTWDAKLWVSFYGNEQTTFTLDVSGVSGYCYVGIHYTTGQPNSMSVKEVYLS